MNAKYLSCCMLAIVCIISTFCVESRFHHRPVQLSESNGQNNGAKFRYDTAQEMAVLRKFPSNKGKHKRKPVRRRKHFNENKAELNAEKSLFLHTQTVNGLSEKKGLYTRKESPNIITPLLLKGQRRKNQEMPKQAGRKKMRISTRCSGGTGPTTFGGNGHKRTCCFPFVFQGKSINHCIATPRGSWCGTTDNYDQHYEWGYCIEKTADTTESNKRPDYHTFATLFLYVVFLGYFILCLWTTAKGLISNKARTAKSGLKEKMEKNYSPNSENVTIVT